MSELPKVTIITAVFNGETNLEQTILSIIRQDYPNLEYIIIDGGSTDSTVNIIRKYDKHIAYWVSEPDLGISDAFNKGIRASTGTYINFQGDGDQLFDNNVISRIIDQSNGDELLISCLIQRVNVDGRPQFVSKYWGQKFRNKLLWKLTVAHQGLFTNRSFFDLYGLFDVENIFCMDYEILLRACHDGIQNIKCLSIIASNWRDDGVGNGRIDEVLDEYHKIKVDNKISNRVMLEVVNFIIKIKYRLSLVLGLYRKY